jgi:hypothetical protein
MSSLGLEANRLLQKGSKSVVEGDHSIKKERKSRGKMRGWHAIRDLIFGMSGYGFSQQAIRMRANIETIFMLSVVGDQIGIPLGCTYYNYRLLPYLFPDMDVWKHRLMRGKDLSEII